MFFECLTSIPSLVEHGVEEGGGLVVALPPGGPVRPHHSADHRLEGRQVALKHGVPLLVDLGVELAQQHVVHGIHHLSECVHVELY